MRRPRRSSKSADLGPRARSARGSPRHRAREAFPAARQASVTTGWSWRLRPPAGRRRGSIPGLAARPPARSPRASAAAATGRRRRRGSPRAPRGSARRATAGVAQELDSHGAPSLDQRPRHSVRLRQHVDVAAAERGARYATAVLAAARSAGSPGTSPRPPGAPRCDPRSLRSRPRPRPRSSPPHTDVVSALAHAERPAGSVVDALAAFVVLGPRKYGSTSANPQPSSSSRPSRRSRRGSRGGRASR